MVHPCFIIVISPSPAFFLLLRLLLSIPPSINIFRHGALTRAHPSPGHTSPLWGGWWRRCGGGAVPNSFTSWDRAKFLFVHFPLFPLCLRSGFLCLVALCLFSLPGIFIFMSPKIKKINIISIFKGIYLMLTF